MYLKKIGLRFVKWKTLSTKLIRLKYILTYKIKIWCSNARIFKFLITICVKLID
jgi:hypothetical protein